MAAALSHHWISAGHEVIIGGRNVDRAKALASDLGAAAGVSLAEAADAGEVVLLAVRGEGYPSTIEASRASHGSLNGKVVIDCGNSVYLPDYSQVRWDGRSMAEYFEYHAIGSSVVKAFNLCESGVWRRPSTFGGQPLTVPFCGNDQAKAVAAPLIDQIGVTGLDIGDLSQARHLEAMAIIMIRALYGGLPLRSAFNLLPADID